MKGFLLLVTGVGIGYWLRYKREEHNRLLGENELLRSKLKENKDKE